MVTKTNKAQIQLQHADCWKYMSAIDEGKVDLVLTDPPYAISRKTGFAHLGANSVERFAVSMEFGEWDTCEIDLNRLASECYRTLRDGGTAIIWYDLWKLTTLADAMRGSGFVQLRLIVWQKTNPVPLNSKRNYLTNSREIAVLGIKGSNPTFNSEYDNGIYEHPIDHSTRYHPTQKPVKLMMELVNKHTNQDDLVLDPFVGGGTTALACLNLKRKFIGCDIEKRYVELAKERLAQTKQIQLIY